MHPNWTRNNTMGTRKSNHPRKKPGDNRVHRLRRINQYEADYNLSLKFHWPKQTQTGEDTQGFLGSNQYGGLKKQAIQRCRLY